MAATARKEAGSGATLSSLQDAKAERPALLLSPVADCPPVSFVQSSLGRSTVTSRSKNCSKRPATFVNLTVLLESGCLGTIHWDEFIGAEIIEISSVRVRLDDAALTRLAIQCELAGLVNVRLPTLRKVVHAIAKANPFDSMKDWLSNLPSWDGTKRVERFLPSCLGTLDRPYERAVGRYWWTAMVARIMEPGYKVDMLPVLVGKQGTHKTSLIENIAPTLEHYGDVRLTERSTELAPKVMGKVVVAWEELRGIGGRRDADEVKTFITNRYVDLRSRTTRGMDQHLRRFIIVGTSNRRDFLRDPTGHRRYLPFDVHSIDLEGVERDKQQLWAEAFHMVLSRQAKGQSLVDYVEAEKLAVVEHQKYFDQGRWVDDEALLAWLDAGNDKFRTDDALRIVGMAGATGRDRSEMVKSLRQLGLDFRPTYFRGKAGRPKSWRQPKAGSGRSSP